MKLLLLILLTLGAGSTQDTVQDDGVATLTLQNVGAAAWQVTAMEGTEDMETVTEANVENPAMTLTVGGRYRFDVSNVNSDMHPLAFRDAEGNDLLTQGGSEGSFELDPAVAFGAEDDFVIFTVTPELADVLSSYDCTVHSAMTGEISTVAAGE